MANITIEYDLKLETILLSMKRDNLTFLDMLSSSKVLNQPEADAVKKYKYLVKTMEISGEMPSQSILKNEFPGLNFDEAKQIPTEEIPEYVQLFIGKRKDQYNAMKLSEISTRVLSEGMSEEIQTELNKLMQVDTISTDYKNIMNITLEEVNSRVNEKGIRVGIQQIDDLTGGIHKGALTTVMGFAGSFKTTLALNIAYNAIEDGYNVLYLSLEVQSFDCLCNLLSRHSFTHGDKAIGHSDIKTKKLNPELHEYVWTKIFPELKSLPGNIYIVDEQDIESYSVYSIEKKMREIDKLCKSETGKGIDLVVIDHAQLLKFSSDMKAAGNETSILNQYVSFFRQQALNFLHEKRAVAVMMLSQTSRGGYIEAARNDGQYRLTALAEANELERASSTVISIYTSEQLKQMDEAKVQLLKSRNGQVMNEPISIYAKPEFYSIGDFNKKDSIDLDVLSSGGMLDINADSDTTRELEALKSEVMDNALGFDINLDL